MEHICEENEMHDTAMASRIYEYGDNNWALSLDCGCCKTSIHFCPYCGDNLLKNETKAIKQMEEI